MLLAVDIGNTETTLGVFRELEPVRSWRIATDRRRTGDELALLMAGFLRSLAEEAPAKAEEAPAKAEAVERVVLASVVPAVDRAWREACRAAGLEPRFVTGATPLPIRLDVDAPAEVGADRIANTLAAAELYGRDTIVVDLGTATTFDCITADGVFIGGVIAPGPRAGMEWLATAAAKLQQVEIRPSARVIGRFTRECVQAGVFYSTVDAIDGIVGRIRSEWGVEDTLVVATGGLAHVVAEHCRTVDRVEPLLTLRGLALADQHLQSTA